MSARKPDRLEAVLVWAVARHETGFVLSCSGDDLREMVDGWGERFELDAAARRSLRDHRWEELEWVDVITEALWDTTGREEGSVWSIEALNHVAQKIAVRLESIEVFAREWAEGCCFAVDSFGSSPSLEEILRDRFPHAGLVLK